MYSMGLPEYGSREAYEPKGEVLSGAALFAYGAPGEGYLG